MNPHNPHLFPEPLALQKVMETEIGNIYFYDNLVVVEAHEGVTLSYATGFSILVKGLQYLGAKSWIYIANRINSYSVNPNDYKYLEKIPTLKGIAIVTPSEIGKKNAALEANFYNKNFTVVDDLPTAYYWAREILGEL
ncbi:hypothetical protein ATE92_2584 [Ulvibacter sp. MAR_2010_11]|uniref:hypothetical protein n=1 Tax=Ulvibacter sp. MAR_2010_11 TaxID=1250229 RepID=UPI000C2B8BDC|nr:hypothetical protein [Ulvibacter sp. MAR_2010_11]PKA84396.1 hypothetical protein ATE92_2584 [Ulvibacter sp. MAR_2010_11]